MLQFLMWDRRMKARQVHLRPSGPRDDRFAFDIAGWSEDVGQNLLSDWGQEDVAEYGRLLERGFEGSGRYPVANNIAHWILKLIEFASIQFQIEGGSLTVDLASTEEWLLLADRLDQDIVVTRWLALRYPDNRVFNTLDDIIELDWGAALRPTNRSLDQILNRGVSDMHIHYGGVRSGLVPWLGLISADDALLERLRSERKFKHDQDTLKYLELARRPRLRQRPVSPDGDPPSVSPLFQLVESASVADGSSYLPFEQRLAKERLMLLRAWRILQQGREETDPEYQKRAETPEYLHLAECVDAYGRAKMLFLSNRSQEFRFGNPGLAAFRRRILGDFGLETISREAWQTFGGIAHDDVENILSYLEQSRSRLARVELRSAPRKHVSQYVKEARSWCERYEEENERQTSVAAADMAQLPDGRRRRIRFAIHLKRSRSGRSGARSSKVSATTEEYRFRAAFDRDTAVFHKFRADETVDVKFRSLFQRIDLAGQERDLRPDVSFFCCLLLRGDHDALDRLYEEAGRMKRGAPATLDRNLHECWLETVRTGNEIAEVDSPSLGISCHAGEDFGHPLIGVSWIARAISGLKMRAGDTIGHALALGASVEEFELRRMSTTLVPLGDQFDALVWLHQLGTSGALPSFPADRARLEDRIRRLSKMVYRQDVVVISDLHMLLDLAAGPAPPPIPSRGEGEQVGGQGASRDKDWYCRPDVPKRIWRMFHDQIHDVECGSRRDEPASCAEWLGDLRHLVEEAQQAVRDAIVDRGVIVEINPSSNVRTSRSLSLASAPYIPIVRSLAPLGLVCINTDNPAIYRTRIEQEYAMVYRGLLDAGCARGEALGLLEEMRATGLRSVF